jgi:aminoglycoside 3-N-acetyltransferase
VGGQILFIGCGLRPNTSLHGVEERVEPPYLYGAWCEYTLRLPNGEQITMNVHNHSFAGWIQRYERVGPLLGERYLRHGQLLQAECHLVDAPALWRAGLRVLRRDPYYFVESQT